jgi:hypothetical protein
MQAKKTCLTQFFLWIGRRATVNEGRKDLTFGNCLPMQSGVFAVMRRGRG